MKKKSSGLRFLRLVRFGLVLGSRSISPPWNVWGILYLVSFWEDVGRIGSSCYSAARDLDQGVFFAKNDGKLRRRWSNATTILQEFLLPCPEYKFEKWISHIMYDLHCDLLAHLIFNRNEHEINLSKIMWLCSIFQENVVFRHHFHWAPLLICRYTVYMY